MRDVKKIKYNLIVGIISQIIILLLGIIVPKLVLTNYGSEINGLLSSVTNIYAYIAIVETGIAAAACQALYKPIVEKNHDSINSILSATNKYYQKTGFIYLSLVFAFSIIFPLFIKSDISYLTVLLIILFNGLGNVVNYFFHGKYLILLRTDGKNFIRTGLETFTNVFKQVSKIVLINLGFNVVLVQFVAMLASFVQMIYITFYIKKKYAWINLKVEPDTKAISQSKHVLVHEINYLITANADTVILTLFTNLKLVSVYSMYQLFFGMIERALRTVRDAIEFKIAHMFHQSKENFLQYFELFETYYITFTFALFSVANFFILPFLKLYTKGVTDINYIDMNIPIWFVLVNLLWTIRYPSDSLIHIAGHFKLTQHSAVIESLINIAVSVILVHFFGIPGVLAGTVISAVYRISYLLYYTSKKIINRSLKSPCICCLVNFVLLFLTIFVNRFINVGLDSYLKIFICCVPYAFCIVSVHLIAVSLIMPAKFKLAVSIFKSVILKKKQ